MEETKGFYIGREAPLNSKGKRKDGTEFSRYLLKFRPFADSEKIFSMTCFTPLKLGQTLQIDTLKEGTEYKILYNARTYTNTQGITREGKTIAGIFLPSQITLPTEKKPQIESDIDLTNFQDFKTKYLENVVKVGLQKSAIHMIGCYVATYEKERTAFLKKLCEEAIK